MTVEELSVIWNYYLSLESDMDRTSQYIEPVGQESTHSFEFAKILILSCTEVESIFKMICRWINGKSVPADISEYKANILGKYPNIVEATVFIPRWQRGIKPYAGWDEGKLPWWDAYQKVKHDRGNAFDSATYENAVYALSALYILIFYLSKIYDIPFENYTSKYIASRYAAQPLICKEPEDLPGFESIKKSESVAEASITFEVPDTPEYPIKPKENN